MARITAIQEEDQQRKPRKAAGKQHATTQPQPAAVSNFILLIPLTVICFSIYCHWRGIHTLPNNSFSQIFNTSPGSLKARLALPHSFGKQWDEVLPPPLNTFIYAPHLIFMGVAQSRVALGLLSILCTIAVPWFTAAILEAIKPGNASHMGLATFTVVSLTGMTLMIGFAIPAAYVPVLAWYGWREATIKPSVIRPLPSPPPRQVWIVLASVLVSGLPVVLLFMISPDKYPQAFFWVAAAQPVLPLAWLPIFATRTPPASRNPGKPRLAASNAYRALAYATIPFWWLGLVCSLRGQWHTGDPLSDDAVTLLAWDVAGLTVGAYAVVLLQAEIDFRAVQCGGPRVHRARLFIEDAIFGSLGTLLLGPGFAFAMYFARREVLAEKARFGIAPTFIAEAPSGEATK